jgi:hypothetical protein
MSDVILNKRYGLYEYYTIHNARKTRVCAKCGKVINVGEFYLAVSYGRSLPELQPYVLCFNCFRKYNPHIKRVVGKKGNVIWEENYNDISEESFE